MTCRLLVPLALAALGFCVIPASGQGKEARAILSDIAIDLDNDGKMDRAMLVLVNPESTVNRIGGGEAHMLGENERVDLYVFLGDGDRAPDLSRKPQFIKKSIVDTENAQMVLALESKAKGSFTISSCYGCGARKSWEQSLTIVSRRGEFLVAGFTRNWEWNVHTSDANVETAMGGCDINFLSGKGVASRDLGEGKPLRTKFKPIKLALWSERKLPKACRFY
ncbi:MAG: hypothetical protein HC855_09270 [Rhizobiales bacterium]|nr:hypothetical protein [Hyphomicrobiales bacterium]